MLEERSAGVGEDIAEIQTDIKCIKQKVYEMAASFRILKWVIGTTLLVLGVLVPVLVT